MKNRITVGKHHGTVHAHTTTQQSVVEKRRIVNVFVDILLVIVSYTQCTILSKSVLLVRLEIVLMHHLRMTMMMMMIGTVYVF